MHAHVLEQPVVLSVVFEHLTVEDLHVARDVCQLWRQEADRALSHTTLHWDYWEDEAPDEDDESDEVEPDLSRVHAFLDGVWESCPFAPHHALLFVGGTRRGGCTELMPTAFSYLRELAPALRVIAFGSRSMDFSNCRIIGTPRSPETGIRKNFRYNNRAGLGVLLFNKDVSIRSVELYEERDRKAALNTLLSCPATELPQEESPGGLLPVAVLLLCSGYNLYRAGQRLLLDFLTECGVGVALGGGVSSGPGLFPRPAPLGVVTIGSTRRGGGVRAVSRVLHGARDEARVVEFIAGLKRLDFPMRRNTVALVFANCAHRESHHTDVECRLFRAAFPAVPVFGWGTVRQVGHESGNRHMKHSRRNPYAMNRSIVFVLLHVPPSL